MDNRAWRVEQAIVPIICSLAALILGFIALTLSPWYSKRIAPIACALAFIPVINQNDVSPFAELNGILARFHVIWILYMPFLVYIKNYDPLMKKFKVMSTKHNYSAATNKQKTFKQRCWLALKMLFNARGIGTKWQVKTIQGMWNTSLGHQTTSRLLFCFRRALEFLSGYAIWYVYVHRADVVVPFDELDYSPEKQTFFRRLLSYDCNGIQGSCHPVALHELIVRAKAFAEGILATWAPVNGLHHVLTVFFVATGIDSPEEWPPLFGSILDAYTIRRWWSSFWHSLIHRMLSGYASLVLREMLLIRGKSTFSHLSHNFLVFLASGLYHEVVLYYEAPQCDKGLIVGYYLMQALGLSIETAVHMAWQQWRWKLAFPETRVELTLTRLVGYLWVLGWFCWVDPKASFAYYRCTLAV